jgi:hypothetical protein
MVENSLRAGATHKIVVRKNNTFEVRVAVPGTHPTTVTGFATRAAAERWVAEHREALAAGRPVHQSFQETGKALTVEGRTDSRSQADTYLRNPSFPMTVPAVPCPEIGRRESAQPDTGATCTRSLMFVNVCANPAQICGYNCWYGATLNV